MRGALRKEIAAYALCALLPVLIRLALLPWAPIPLPHVHDEFSLLVGADTVAHGRLSNPPHPLWEFFETFHVNPQPRYMTKYQAGMPLLLGAAQRITGTPWAGVLFAQAAFGAALFWALRGWGPFWAASSLALYEALRTGFATGATFLAGAWLDNYWGGALPAAGGALVTGAAARLMRRPDLRAALAGAVGLVILTNTRPFEGVVVAAVACGATLIAQRTRHAAKEGRAWARVGAVLVAALIADALWLGCYNYRCTGNPWETPFQLHDKLYARASVFWLLPLRDPPQYRHTVLQRFWTGYEVGLWEAARRSQPAVTPVWLVLRGAFYLPYILMFLPLAGIVFVKSGRIRMACGMLVAAVLIAFGPQKFLLTHYLSPALGLFLVVVMAGLRLCALRYGKRGRRAMLAALAASAAGSVVSFTRAEHPERRFSARRAEIAGTLARQGGAHVVIVSYGAAHDVHQEWVYNGADIDAQTVIWARDMGANNERLLAYYRGRRFWTVEPDTTGMPLRPYGGAR